jgi:hypothetical protein
MPALEVTVEALMFALRSDGTGALKDAHTLRRLSGLSDEQLEAVVDRLISPKHAAWKSWAERDVLELLTVRGGLT